MRLTYRKYSPQDREACLRVFRSNVPRYFRAHELPGFTKFLDAGEWPYFVFEWAGTVVGCGGFAAEKIGTRADLCWGMMSAESHGQRFGEFLLLARLIEIIKDETIPGVRLGTSQLTEGFFQKYGFKTQSVIPNGIADGLDEIEMHLNFTPEARAQICEHWNIISSVE